VRDVLFVDDLVDAFGRARLDIDRLSGRAFNIGGGPGHTVSLLELIQQLRELLDRPIEVRFDAWRVGDQRYYVSDTGRFLALTGWRARTQVARGVEALCDWLAAPESHPAHRHAAAMSLHGLGAAG